MKVGSPAAARSLVDALEAGQRQVDLAAHLDHRGGLRRRMRSGIAADRAQVGGDVLADARRRRGWRRARAGRSRRSARSASRRSSARSRAGRSPPSPQPRSGAGGPGVELVALLGVGQRQHRQGWRDRRERADGCAPTRWVGESGVTSSGCSASSACSSRSSASYSASRPRLVEHVVAVVGLVDLLAQLSHALLGAHAATSAAISSGDSNTSSGCSASSCSREKDVPPHRRCRGHAGARARRAGRTASRPRIRPSPAPRPAPAARTAAAGIRLVPLGVLLGDDHLEQRAVKAEQVDAELERRADLGRDDAEPGPARVQPGQHLAACRRSLAAAAVSRLIVRHVDVEQLGGAVAGQVPRLLGQRQADAGAQLVVRRDTAQHAAPSRTGTDARISASVSARVPSKSNSQTECFGAAIETAS